MRAHSYRDCGPQTFHSSRNIHHDAYDYDYDHNHTYHHEPYMRQTFTGPYEKKKGILKKDNSF